MAQRRWYWCSPSYEKILWTVKNAGNAKVAALLLSGHHESDVIGLDNTKTLKIGGDHAYKLDSGRYNLLKTEVWPNVCNSVTRSKGRYEEKIFSDFPKNTGVSSL